MRNRGMWFQKSVCCITTVCFLTVSIGSVFAQDSTKVSNASKTQTTAATQTTAQVGAGTIAQIEDQARLDAKADIKAKAGTWFVVGCLLGLVGWLIAYIVEPNPPATRLLGKSADYVAVYTDAYKKAGKSAQATRALGGCIVGEAASILLYAIILSSK
jgi:hypothetical protein